MKTFTMAGGLGASALALLTTLVVMATAQEIAAVNGAGMNHVGSSTPEIIFHSTKDCSGSGNQVSKLGSVTGDEGCLEVLKERLSIQVRGGDVDAGKRCLYLYKKSDCPDKEQEANLKDIKAVPFEVVDNGNRCYNYDPKAEHEGYWVTKGDCDPAYNVVPIIHKDL